jgi:PAS domain S-box-containing protein
MTPMHSLLKRQIKRHFGDGFEIPAAWRPFIDRVNEAYAESDADRAMLEHSLELSSEELIEANTQSLRLLGSAVEQSSDAIVITDAQPDRPEARIQFVNPAFTHMTGYTPAEVLGKSMSILDGPKTEREPLRRLRESLLKGERCAGTTLSYRKDGTEFELEWHVVPLRDSRGAVTHVLSMHRDITERVRTENALRESEEHFRFLNDVGLAARPLSDPKQIMETMTRMLGENLRASRCAYADVHTDNDSFTIVHDYTDGCVSTVGQYHLSLFGERAAETLRAGQTLVIRNVAAELGVAQGADTFRAIGIQAIITCPLIKDGSLRAMMAVHQALPRDWTPGEIALVQDVVERCWATVERRTAEEKLRESKRFTDSIAANSTSIIYVLDLETKKNIYASRSISKRLGYSQEQFEKFAGDISNLIHPQDRPRVARHFAELAEVRDARVIDIEYRLRHADGRWFWIWSRDAVFNRRADGSACQVMGTAQDITERKLAEAELEATHKKLLEASRRAGMAEIATNVLHNVGNILNSVNVSAALVESKLRKSRARGLTQAVRLMDEHAHDLGDFLTRDEKGKLVPRYLSRTMQQLAKEQQDMMEELEHLTRSIDHIKAVVATQQSYAGRPFLLEPVQICELAEDALRMNSSVLARHHVTVVKKYAPVPVVQLDRSRVLQILVNLISNAGQAVESAAADSHVITVKIDAVEGSSIRVRVKDEGEGIAQQNLTRMFAHGFTTRKSGHGFGLHSCALAARQMGGTLTAHSDGPGKGAVFTLELPITTGRASTPQQQKGSNHDNAKQSPHPAG